MKIRVIVFDDNDFIRLRVSQILSEKGYEVFEFTEAGNCPLRLRKECSCPLTHACADIIITDINMPGMTGLEFIQNQLKQGCRVKHWTVMTFQWTSEQIDQAKRFGCHMLEKPFEEEVVNWLVKCEKTIDPHRILSDWFIVGKKADADWEM